MPNPQLSILVVDDAKFSSVMIGRALTKAGYEDIRFANSASAALELIEQRPANVLLADWLMPEMDGLELTAQVRQQDEMSDHYTYIILLTGRDGQDVRSFPSLENSTIVTFGVRRKTASRSVRTFSPLAMP